MECQECVKENAYSIKHRGYGYGYIGKYLNCSRHNKKSQQIEQLPTKSQQIEQLPNLIANLQGCKILNKFLLSRSK